MIIHHEFDMSSISHDRDEETPEAKARWFQSLTMEQRLAHFAEFYNLALQLNPDIVSLKDVPPPSARVRIHERTDQGATHTIDV
jgi:hypothetical protein